MEFGLGRMGRSGATHLNVIDGLERSVLMYIQRKYSRFVRTKSSRGYRNYTSATPNHNTLYQFHEIARRWISILKIEYRNIGGHS